MIKNVFEYFVIRQMFWMLIRTFSMSFEYPQHMFWLRDKKVIFKLSTVIERPEFTLSFFLLVALLLTADNHCKQFGHRSNLTVSGLVWI